MIDRTEVAKNSLAHILPNIDRVSERFYATLLARDHSLRPILDRVDARARSVVLRNGLAAIVANLDRPLVLESILHEIGRIHHRLGVRRDQIGIALDSLLYALREVVPNWDATLEEAWIEVAAVMMEHIERGMVSGRLRPVHVAGQDNAGAN